MQKFLKFESILNLKVLIAASLFAASSIVFGKFLAISIGDTLRFSFENLPIILSGVMFGPSVGALTALIADIVGCILRGYAINPILTAAAVLTGFLSGAVFQLLHRLSINFRALITVFLCHSLCSVIIKTLGLHLWYSTPIGPLFLTRLINYAVVAAGEYLLLSILLGSRAFLGQMKKFSGE